MSTNERCAPKRTVVALPPCDNVETREQTVATKEHKRQAKALVEELEARVHVGPPICTTELASAHNFLRESEFSPASDYFGRLRQIQDRLTSRPAPAPVSRSPGKRDYGGEAAGYWMQVQSAYDHVILSICYEGEFNWKRGRVKISHRFNQEGRIDFVEAKLLREAEAYVLEVLPKELIFLYDNIFRCDRTDVFAWLANVGHRQVGDLLDDLSKRLLNGAHPNSRDGEQMDLSALRKDQIAWPILTKAALLESVVEILDSKNVVVRYHGN